MNTELDCIQLFYNGNFVTYLENINPNVTQDEIVKIAGEHLPKDAPARVKARFKRHSFLVLTKIND